MSATEFCPCGRIWSETCFLCNLTHIIKDRGEKACGPLEDTETVKSCEWLSGFWSVLNNSQTHTNSPLHGLAPDSHRPGLAGTAPRQDPPFVSAWEASLCTSARHTPHHQSVVKGPCTHSYLGHTLGVWDPGIPRLTRSETTCVGIPSPPNHTPKHSPPASRGGPRWGWLSLDMQAVVPTHPLCCRMWLVVGKERHLAASWRPDACASHATVFSTELHGVAQL